MSWTGSAAGAAELENHYIDELVSGQSEPPRLPAPGQHDRHVDDAPGGDPGRVRRSPSRHVLGFSSSTSAAPAPPKGGTLRIGDADARRGHQPADDLRRRRPADAQPDRRVPVFDNNLQADAAADARARAGSRTADGSVWTFKLRPGVKFHNGQPMTADDVVYTFQQLSDPEERVQRAVDVRRRADARRREEGRLDDRRVPPRGAQRQLPLPRLLGQLQRDHRPQGHRLRQVAEDVHRAPARSSSGSYTPERRRQRSSPIPTTGAASRCLDGTHVQVLHRASSRRSSRSRATTST